MIVKQVKGVDLRLLNKVKSVMLKEFIDSKITDSFVVNTALEKYIKSA